MTDALTHLKHLVAFDTRNPPRDVKAIGALFEYTSSLLEVSGFTCAQRNLGDGCLWLRAVRSPVGGAPLVNVHIDTVPADEGWSGDPFQLHVDDARARAVGLGACDIKGALAAFLAAAASTRGAVELLLTSDEEAGSSRCVRTYCSEQADTLRDRATLVAEPTRCQAVLAHRGIATAVGTFNGTAGHASQARAFEDSAVHEAVRWSTRALTAADVTRAGGPGSDVRLNIGRIEGGTKANMIASSAVVRFGVRPHGSPADVADALCALAPNAARVTWERGYLAPALLESAGTRALAAAHALDVSEPVDFFTEAALFAEAGARAIVLGPGDIAQAHTAGEYVELSQLEQAERIYARVLGGAA